MAATRVGRGLRTPTRWVGTSCVPPGPVATAIAETTHAPRKKNATVVQLLVSPPSSDSAIVGEKPASAKPNWVPIAIPESLTLVGKYSAYVAGHTAFGML